MHITIDLDRVKKKLSQESFDKGQYAAANQMLSDMNQYVPKDEGSLRLTGTVEDNGKSLTWNMPYAKAQFYGFVGKGGFRVYKYTTPGTSRRWDLRAKGAHMNDWVDTFIKGAGW